MKRFFTAVIVLFALSVVSCDPLDDSLDNNTDSTDSTTHINPADTTIDGFVDLGLPSGLLWAECNLGAATPEEFGNYYAWGETLPKSEYNWMTYRYCTVDSSGGLQMLTKYNYQSRYGVVDSLETLEAMDDAATAALGAEFRMPGREDWVELRTNTTCQWVEQNGIGGWKFVGNNGNSIFLPAAGCRELQIQSDAGVIGFYWSSSIGSNSPVSGRYFYFSSTNATSGNYNRYYGFSVRPVRQK